VSGGIPLELQALVEAANGRQRVVAVTDYLLVTSQSYDARIPAGHPAASELGAGVRLELVDRTLAERLLHATELRGENWPGRPRSASDVVHAYVRAAWEEGCGEPPALWQWDADGVIYRCVQLSRLVRDNATSTEHAARHLTLADGTHQIVPFHGFYSHVAHRLYPSTPGWLDVAEAGRLAALVASFGGGATLPARVRRALRRTDSVTRERYLEDALPLVVGGLESLLKVGREASKEQFAQRVPALADEVGVALTSTQCRELYADRSALVHGDAVDLSVPRTLTTFEQGFVALQETLRRAVRCAIENRGFAAVFAQDKQIQMRWQTTIKTNRNTRYI